MEEYLNLPQIGINNDPLTWWKLHSTKFPILSELSAVRAVAPPARARQGAGAWEPLDTHRAGALQ